MNEWNDIAVLTPPGDVDIASVPVLRRRLDNLIERGVRRVVINCQAVALSTRRVWRFCLHVPENS